MIATVNIGTDLVEEIGFIEIFVLLLKWRCRDEECEQELSCINEIAAEK